MASLSMYQVSTMTSATSRPSIAMLLSEKSGLRCGFVSFRPIRRQAGFFMRSELRRIKRSGVVCSAVVAPESVNGEVFRGMGRFDGSILSVDYGAGSVEEEEEDDKVVSGHELAVRKLGLPQRLVESLEQRGITQLFPIQRAVLIPALEGRDIIARAKTGTGKTLAFGIPILKQLTEDDEGRSHQRQSGRFPRVLVLAPTRELARQVEKEIKDSAPYLKTVCVYGGVPYSTQQSALRSGVDVVVGTPGRLIDLIKGNSLQLGEVQFLVLDEADQMLAVGFEEDVELILERLPSKRQSMLFSATMPAWVNKLARKYLDKPLTIDLVGDRDEKLAEGIKLYAVPTASSNSKRSILSDLIMVYAKGKKTIVFTQTKRDADEVSMALAHSIASEPLHGDITQYQRERTLNAFRVGRFSVLVATNVAARGLDIPNVDLVIHYELPNDAETFVHRSGRTGRAGNEGTVILMFTGAQRRTIKSLERDVGCKFEYINSPSVEQVSEAAVFRTTELPSSQYGGSPGSHYGRYNQRGGSGGGPRGRRGDSQSYGRNSSDNDGYRRGGSSFRTENSSLRSAGRPTRVGGSDRSDFGGSCFTCGRSGHKASDCPNKRAY